uniref:HSNSD domain-containing protein n=1 Tax=Macrostomum lignano TaxID=282301 RepID=A0A1I8GWV4_9PLAT
VSLNHTRTSKGLAVGSERRNDTESLVFANEADNVTAMEFGPFTEELGRKLPTTEHVMLYDLLSAWTEFVRQLACGNGTLQQRKMSPADGNISPAPDGAVVRDNWRLGIYRNLPLRPELVSQLQLGAL